MDKNTAMITLEFLKRTQLQGQEVAAYTQVVVALEQIINDKKLEAVDG